MSRINNVQDTEFPIFMGMDSTSPLTALKPGYVPVAYNCRPGLEGGCIKRDGYATVLSSTYGLKSITGGVEFMPSSGTAKVVVYAADGTIGSGQFGFISGGGVTSIQTGLDGSQRPAFVQTNNLLFYFNGSDSPLVYDGTNVYQNGITAPVSAPTVALTTGGSLNTNSNYIWCITYYNSVTKAESSPSPLSATTATSTNTKANLTFVAGSSTTADTIRVWRTFANGNQLFLDGTTGISSTTYASSVSDSGLQSTALELDNTRVTTISSTAKYPAFADRRIFLKSAANTIIWSKIGQSGPMPQSFQTSAVCSTVGRYGSNDDIVGLANAGDTIIVLKQRSVGMLSPTGLPSNLLPVDPVAYIYTELTSDIGAVSHFGATSVYGECIFLGKDNIYGTNGQPNNVRPIANSIQATIKSLGWSSTQVAKVSAINDERLRMVYFAVFSTSNKSQPDYVIAGDYQLYPQFRWTLYVPGTSTSTWPGISAACFFSVTDATDGGQDIYFGSTSLNGQVYQMNTGSNSDNGSGIYFQVTTHPYGFGNPAAWKLCKETDIYAGGSGANYSLSVSSIYDLSGQEEDSGTYSLYNGGATWDNVTWDNFTWSSASIPPVRYQNHRKAYWQQVVIRQTDASAPVTLHSWYPSASIFKVF